jgi:hypothetical protein
MSNTNALQLSAVLDGKILTVEQKRFNTLVKQVEKARLTNQAWHDNVPLYQQAENQVLTPLRKSLVGVRRLIAFALDGALNQSELTRKERDNLRDLLSGLVMDLLEDSDADEALKSLYNKHNDVDIDAMRQDVRLKVKDMAQAVSGVDLGADDGIQSDTDLMARFAQKMQEEHAKMQAEHEARAHAKAERLSKRKPSAAQRKKALEEEKVTQSIREIFRQLASALHPDREPNPAERERKTELMQKANAAYASNDLFALLALQLQIEQLDAASIANVSASRLMAYSKILSKQLSDLREEAGQLEDRFRYSFHIDVPGRIDPSKLIALVERGSRELRSELVVFEREAKIIQGDMAGLKRWIKQQSQLVAAIRQQQEMDFFDLGF